MAYRFCRETLATEISLAKSHLCRARLRFSRQCQSNIDNHIPQINPWIREPCLENLGRTLPSDEPAFLAALAVSVGLSQADGETG
ncbi:hypothetical protein CA85_03170 [Allorhodopirellula solitaria]|uniref:Uncharacterized protein n=1 Tax=Allorhodopirellula solitaria TaxID=2527987 RepID=A0A5C5YJN7_9BACT|nr:hypothetical protein CA85_03170 [Allorhodopirellula solitaria]